jgi:hypothetical protein
MSRFRIQRNQAQIRVTTLPDWSFACPEPEAMARAGGRIAGLGPFGTPRAATSQVGIALALSSASAGRPRARLGRAALTGSRAATSRRAGPFETEVWQVFPHEDEGLSSSVSTECVTCSPRSRSLWRSVARAIPNTRAAWCWLPPVYSRTNGNSTRSTWRWVSP